MTTTILLIRHGQSQANTLGVFAGSQDYPLTPLGLLQAQKTASFLQDKPIDALYTSDLNRASQTGEALAKGKGIQLIYDPAFREIYGGEWENKKYKDLSELYPQSYDTWKNNIGLSRCDGGESFAQLQQRVVKEICKLAHGHNGQTIAIATHACPVRAFTAWVKGIPLDELSKRTQWTSNASVSIAICENGVWSMQAEGLDAHLEDLKSYLPKDA